MSISKPGAIVVPIASGDTCGHRNPRTNTPCNRTAGHSGRHAFKRLHIHPGLVREVWA